MLFGNEPVFWTSEDVLFMGEQVKQLLMLALPGSIHG